MCVSVSVGYVRIFYRAPSPKNAEEVTFISIQIQFQVESFHTCPSCSLSGAMSMNIVSDAIKEEMERL